MSDTVYKRPKVEKYDCPVCGKNMKVSFGTPTESICRECKHCGAMSGVGGIYHYENADCSKPPLFNRETIENGFKTANEKWNRRKT